MPRPVITSMTPTEIPAGQVANLVVQGAYLQNAVPRIAGDNNSSLTGIPSKGMLPDGRLTPTVSLVSVDPAGQTMTVQVDATDPKVEGWYNLFGDNGSHEEDPTDENIGQFRVNPPGPIIDLWTPSEMSINNAFFFSVLGAQLAGASVTSLDPNVVITYLHNESDTAITGLIHALDGAPIGSSVEIEVSRNGIAKRVPIAMTPTLGELSSRTENAAGSLLASGNTASAESLPPIYVQEPKILLADGSAEALSNPPTLGAPPGDICATFNGGVRAYDSGVLFDLTFFDGLLPVPPQLVASAVGVSTTVTYFTIAYKVGLNLDAWLIFCSGSEGGEGDYFDAGFCASGYFGLDAPGFAGFLADFSYCDGIHGGGSHEITGGSVSNVSWTSSDPCITVEEPYCPPGDETCLTGKRSATFHVNSCCEEPVDIAPIVDFSSPLVGFYSGPLDPLAVELSPDAACPDSELKVFVDVGRDFDPNNPVDDLDSFLPGQKADGATATIRDGQCDIIDLVLAKIDNQGRVVVGGPQQQYEVRLEETSDLKGVAMNSGTDEGPDYRFPGGGPDGSSVSVTLPSGTQGVVRQPLEVCDYGGFTKVAVQRPGESGSLLELTLPVPRPPYTSFLASDGHSIVVLPAAPWRDEVGNEVTAARGADDDDSQPPVACQQH